MINRKPGATLGADRACLARAARARAAPPASGCYAFGITLEKVSLDGLPDTAICTERFRSVLLSFDLSAHALHARGVLLLRRSSVRNRRRRLAGLSMNPNQTTFNTAFVLYVLSCVEFFGLRSARRRRLRLFSSVSTPSTCLIALAARALTKGQGRRPVRRRQCSLWAALLGRCPRLSLAQARRQLLHLRLRPRPPGRLPRLNFRRQLFRVGGDFADS